MWNRIHEALAAAGALGNGQDAHVLLVYAVRANDDGEAWPSVAQLAADTGYSERGVRYSLGRLERRGLLHDTGRRIGRTGRVRVFKVLPNAALAAALDSAHLADQSGSPRQVIRHATTGNPAPGAAGIAIEPPRNPQRAIAREGLPAADDGWRSVATLTRRVATDAERAAYGGRGDAEAALPLDDDE
jgi:helix-turn-helix protein